MFFGSIQEMDRLSGASKRVIHGFKAPIHALMIDDGSLIVAEVGTGNLLKVTGEKEEDRKIIATELAAPTWLVSAGPGAVYVAEFITGTISRIDLGSGEKKVVVSGLRGPEGFAVKPDGKFVVVEEKTRQLVEVDPASGTHKPLVVNLEIGSPPFPGGAPFGNVASVAVSESGAIYLTADINNAIYKISPK
jgi:DNA-binding beta-propeller fold protein YncE